MVTNLSLKVWVYVSGYMVWGQGFIVHG